MKLEQFDMCWNIHDTGSDWDENEITEDAWIFVPLDDGVEWYQMVAQISYSGLHEPLPHNWAFVGVHR